MINISSIKIFNDWTLETVIFISTLIFIYSSSGQTFKTDKYKGRGLDIAAFERELLCFFSDGTGKLRKCVISSLLRQLRQLRRTLASLESFRFYSRYAHIKIITVLKQRVSNIYLIFIQGCGKVWKSGVASDNGARRRCCRCFLICQNLGGLHFGFKWKLWTLLLRFTDL